MAFFVTDRWTGTPHHASRTRRLPGKNLDVYGDNDRGKQDDQECKMKSRPFCGSQIAGIDPAMRSGRWPIESSPTSVFGRRTGTCHRNCTPSHDTVLDREVRIWLPPALWVCLARALLENRAQWQAGSERKIALTCLATLSATAPDIPPTPDVGTRNKPIAFIGLGQANAVACGVTDSSAGTRSRQSCLGLLCIIGSCDGGTDTGALTAATPPTAPRKVASTNAYSGFNLSDPRCSMDPPGRQPS
jgi:hypothetical protein